MARSRSRPRSGATGGETVEPGPGRSFATPSKSCLLPPSLRDWLRPDHPVYFVSDVVDGFDLSAILDKYTETRLADHAELGQNLHPGL